MIWWYNDDGYDDDDDDDDDDDGGDDDNDDDGYDDGYDDDVGGRVQCALSAQRPQQRRALPHWFLQVLRGGWDDRW